MAETASASQQAIAIHPGIFREYDIRGIMEQTLSAEVAYTIGRAFATRTQGGTICVGRDGRLSSPLLHEALCNGILAAGGDVVDVGLGPTPMLYYATAVMKAAGGVMLTGSHNPPDHNGFKFMLGKKPFYGADIQGLRKICETNEFASGQGAYKAHDIRAEYLDALTAAFKPGRKLRVAWDCGNGATGEITEKLADRLPVESVLLNATIDGTFPAHHPDPTVPKNLEQVIEAVRVGKCDIGIAFDGDGDRIGIVDNEGGILWGDQLLVLLAQPILARMPGATIIADVKASSVFFDEINRMGGKALMWKTGHSLIKAKMAETGAPLAGEMSGHIFFADEYFGFDDGLYAAVRLLSLLAASDKTLADMRKDLPHPVSTPEIRFECADERKFAVIDEVAARLKDEGADVVTVDGVRVNTSDGWWLLRASNTQAMLVARCEGKDDAGLQRLKAALAAQLAKSNVSLP